MGVLVGLASGGVELGVCVLVGDAVILGVGEFDGVLVFVGVIVGVDVEVGVGVTGQQLPVNVKLVILPASSVNEFMSAPPAEHSLVCEKGIPAFMVADFGFLLHCIHLTVVDVSETIVNPEAQLAQLGVDEGVIDGVGVIVLVAVWEGVCDGVLVGVEVKVGVGVGVVGQQSLPKVNAERDGNGAVLNGFITTLFLSIPGQATFTDI